MIYIFKEKLEYDEYDNYDIIKVYSAKKIKKSINDLHVDYYEYVKLIYPDYISKSGKVKPSKEYLYNKGFYDWFIKTYNAKEHKFIEIT